MVRCWIVFIITMVLCLLYGKSESQKKRCVFLITFVMVCFSGLRSWWYGDLIKYYTRYITESTQSLQEIYSKIGLRNIGLSLLYKIAFSVFGAIGYDVVIFVVALFSGIALAKIVLRHSSSPYWSFLMYFALGFYMFTFSGLKQTIAMAWLCYALDGLLENKNSKFFFFVLAAALFHTPALIFILAYPLSKIRFGRTYWLFIFCVIGGMLIFRTQIVQLLGESYGDESAVLEYFKKGNSGVGGRFLMMIFIMAVAYCMRPPFDYDNKYNKIFGIMALAASMQTLSIYDNTFTRLADYFYQFSVLFVPMFMEPIIYEEDYECRKFGLFTNNIMIHQLLSVGITVFGIWFFSTQVRSVDYLGKLLFFWEQNGHLLYGR